MPICLRTRTFLAVALCSKCPQKLETHLAFCQNSIFAISGDDVWAVLCVRFSVDVSTSEQSSSPVLQKRARYICFRKDTFGSIFCGTKLAACLNVSLTTVRAIVLTWQQVLRLWAFPLLGNAFNYMWYCNGHANITLCVYCNNYSQLSLQQSANSSRVVMLCQLMLLSLDCSHWHILLLLHSVTQHMTCDCSFCILLR